MRSPLPMLMALTITACSTASSPVDTGTDPDPSETGPRWITMDGDALETARAALQQRDPSAQLEVADMWNNVALVRFDAQDFKVLSQLMHETHHRCGGFVVHESLDEALGALRAKDQEGIAPLIAYTIDNAATVNGLLPQLSQSTLLNTIQGLAAFPTRHYTSATGGQASTWLRDKWAGYASAAGRTDVTVELFASTWAQKSVIATIPGSSLASEFVVVGAHLDSINQSGGNAPGADDDASGIATISEALRVMMTQNYRPRRTVKFMAYAAEEVGLLGSKAIVSYYKASAVNVVGVLQLDMTNYKGSVNDIYIFTDYTNGAQNTFVANLIDTYLPGVTRGTDACGYGCSDHASWHNAGYPTSMPFESRMSEYNPTIHSSNDTLAQSGNDAAHAIKFARLTTAYIAELAKGTLGTSTNTPPTVSITAPANGSTHPQGTSVTFTGSASDAQDGTLSGAIQWSSSIDGALGAGASIARVLSVGAHTITASVTDSGGLGATTTISVTITGTSTTLFSDDFEGTASWTSTGLWHVVNNSTCASPGYSSATRAMYFGLDASCTYSNATRVTGTTTSPVITGVTSTSTLSFKYYRRVESEPGSYDVASVQAVDSSGTATTLWSRSSANASNTLWNDSGTISLSAYAGQSIQLRFKFDSIDSAYNSYTGWIVDDVKVTR